MPDAISINAFEAERDIPKLGIKERAGFLGESENCIFAMLHAPVGECHGGVLVCPPLYAESPRNHRRELLLGRRLAASGIAVLRFQYYGTSHSHGDVEETSFPRFCEDAAVAAGHLVSELSGVPIGFFGTRLGGCVAAATAMSFPDAPIAMWEPVLDGHAYLREIFRLQLMSDLTGGAEVAETQQSLISRLQADGAVDLLGFSIGRDLYDSLVPVDMTELLKATNGPLLLLEIARQEDRRPYRALIEHLRGSGRDLDTTRVEGVESWWFSHGPDTLQDRSEPVSRLIDITCGWFAGGFTKVPT